MQNATRLDYDVEEADLEFLKARSTVKRPHSNDGEDDGDDDADDDDINDNVDDKSDESAANSVLRKRSLHGIRASIGSSRQHRPRQRQRQRHRQRMSDLQAGARTDPHATVSTRPATGGGRRRPTNAGRRKGWRYRGLVKPARPFGSRPRARPRPSPAVALLADDAGAVHNDNTPRPELVQNETERKSCKQLTCVEGRGMCVNDGNSGARCRCRLGAAGSFCERGT